MAREALVSVEWPNRRTDVLQALEVIASPPPALTADGWDTRMYNLTEAIHAVVDDTPWDVYDPKQSIGTILESEAEADACRSVVQAVITVSDRQGPSAPDRDWYNDGLWPTVQELAARAVDLMRRE
ncbi:SCO4402 family protein [Nocardioides luteus]|uniref:SCO4402 family protein n=1 Tax=Nocardioides luteus TaxID=1844 RepID=UPI0018CAFA2A|nr:hypothetical protein [Nocardioides luteus]MBG6095963.1 hypothetical protein [Nocardioides luteus]